MNVNYSFTYIAVIHAPLLSSGIPQNNFKTVILHIVFADCIQYALLFKNSIYLK